MTAKALFYHVLTDRLCGNARLFVRGCKVHRRKGLSQQCSAPGQLLAETLEQALALAAILKPTWPAPSCVLGHSGRC